MAGKEVQLLCTRWQALCNEEAGVTAAVAADSSLSVHHPPAPQDTRTVLGLIPGWLPLQNEHTSIPFTPARFPPSMP